MIRIRKVGKEVLNFFFPNLCACCEDLLETSESLLCKTCLQHLFLTLPTFNLKGCFRFEQIVLTLDHPLLSSVLIRQAKQKESLYQVLASFMVVQLQKTECSSFDFVVSSTSKKRFFNHPPSYFLAKYLGEMFEAPSTDLKDPERFEDKVVLIVEEKLNLDSLEEISKKIEKPKMLFAIAFSR